MSFGKIYDIASSGLSAQRTRVQLIAANIANSDTTRTPEGGPFRKKDAIFKIQSLGRTVDGMPLTGVKIAEVVNSKEPFVLKFDPDHPDAGPDGNVQFPNINPVEEMVNLTEASRAYDANVAVVRAVRSMTQSAQELLRVQ